MFVTYYSLSRFKGTEYDAMSQEVPFKMSQYGKMGIFFVNLGFTLQLIR